LTAFTPQGDFDHVTSVAGPIGQMHRQNPGFPMVVDAHMLNHRWTFLEPAITEPPIPTTTEVRQDTVPLLVLNGEGTHLTELGRFAATEFLFHDRIGMLRRFGSRLHVASDGDVLYVGSSGDTIVTAWSPFSGEKLYEIAIPGRRALTRQDIDLARRTMLNASLRSRLADVPDDLMFPQHFPLFSDLLADSDGRLWIQLYQAPQDDTKKWLVYDSGNLVGHLELGANVQLLDAGQGFALIMITDDLDVATIRLHELLR
jgi:hypothetical protein